MLTETQLSLTLYSAPHVPSKACDRFAVPPPQQALSVGFTVMMEFTCNESSGFLFTRFEVLTESLPSAGYLSKGRALDTPESLEQHVIENDTHMR